MNKERSTKKIFWAKLTGSKTKDRLNLRWIDRLERDFTTLTVTNWKTIAKKKKKKRTGGKFLRKSRPSLGFRIMMKNMLSVPLFATTFGTVILKRRING
ncbi:hypothetical protein TNCV_4382381 [Trichonephila clavipes]|nr:hypothetical protein TNCV_4382381 [Trichonephila clavipes]